METKRVLSIIFSILFIGAFAFVLSWGIINFNKVQDGLSGTGVYTKEDVDNAYKDGYSTALDNEKEYTKLIDGYRDTITSQSDEISKLSSQVTLLTNTNKDYIIQLSNLEMQKVSLEEQVDNLYIIKSNNEATISELNLQIYNLESEIIVLRNSNLNKDDLILSKNNQIASLQVTISQLQRTNELNVGTINNLNNQIASLNTQITDMTLQIQNNSINVTALNNKIAELEKSVAYYEQYISNLENGEQVVVTFEFNGSVYNIQIINKNDTVSVVNPTSTDNVIFNYWTVNGEQIDLSTYQITSNTKIVANVTYKYDVKFMVDDTEYNKQIVIKNGYATIPANPTKTGYEFDGWTTNGVDIVNPNITAITQNTTYVAKFTKLHTVTFMYEDTSYTTQTVRNNEYSTNVTVENTDYKVFNGWKLNGAIVDVTTQKIVADTTFVADITYKYDVKFMVDDVVYNSQIVVMNGYATIPTNPTKTGYEFSGWSINGQEVVDLSNYSIKNNEVFTAIFTRLSGLYNIIFSGMNSFEGSNIWTDGENTYYSSSSNHYVLNKSTNTWTKKSWTGLNTFNGANIWTDGIDTYHTSSNVTYVLNKETSTWSQKDWNISIDRTLLRGSCIWSDGENIYFNSAWSEQFGGTTYYSYMLNKSTNTWVEKTWNIDISSGSCIWTNGIDIYYTISSVTYILNKSTNTWFEKTWNVNIANSSYIWTDGINTYYSNNGTHYILDKSTNTWFVKNWNITTFTGNYIWSDGTNTYYSYKGTNYIIYV